MNKIKLILALLLAPFFSQANIFTDGTVLTQTPDLESQYPCTFNHTGEKFYTKSIGACGSALAEKSSAEFKDERNKNFTFLQWDLGTATIQKSYCVNYDYFDNVCNEWIITSFGNVGYYGSPIQYEKCPPATNPTYTFPYYSEDSGKIERCADPANIEINDSCNHSDTHDAMSNYLINITATEQSVCAALPDGSMCRYSSVDVGVGGQVYQYDYEGDSCYETPDIDLVEIPDVQLPSYNESMGDFQCIEDGGLLACSETPENVIDQDGNAPDGCGNIGGVYGCYSTDTDNDTLPDYLDPDIDGDGIRNEDDLDADGDGVDDIDRGGSGSSSGSGSGSGSVGGTINVELDLEPVVSELKKLNETNVEIKTEPNLEQESFWQSDYENGFQGMFEEKTQEIKSTALFSFIDKFQPNISGGSPANYNFCFNLGSMGNFGCHQLGIDARVIPAIKILILISAAFACRRIIFGG